MMVMMMMMMRLPLLVTAISGDFASLLVLRLHPRRQYRYQFLLYKLSRREIRTTHVWIRNPRGEIFDLICTVITIRRHFERNQRHQAEKQHFVR